MVCLCDISLGKIRIKFRDMDMTGSIGTWWFIARDISRFPEHGLHYVIGEKPRTNSIELGYQHVNCRLVYISISF